MAFRRMGQKMNESFHKTEKTAYDADFERMCEDIDKLEKRVIDFINHAESFLQQDPNVRTRGILPTGSSKIENLANSLQNTGRMIGKELPLGASTLIAGEGVMKMAEAERLNIKQIDEYVLKKLREFLNSDMKTIIKERKTLEQKRLDMDAFRGKARKAKKDEEQKSLKEKADAAETEFQAQYEIVRNWLSYIPEYQEQFRQRTRDFLKAQINYFRTSADSLEASSKQY